MLTEDTYYRIYGPFVPGSPARALRHENAKRGLRTCWRCLTGYRPHARPGASRALTRGRGAYYCSWECYRLDQIERSPTRRGPRHKAPPSTPEDILAEMRNAHRRLSQYVGD